MSATLPPRARPFSRALRLATALLPATLLPPTLLSQELSEPPRSRGLS
jgi:hypothetical protein